MDRTKLGAGRFMGETKRICLTVAYDGTAYCGWQVQKNGRTIEGELNRALRELTGEDIQVIGASRTDAGVHGLANRAVFDTCSRIPGEKFSYALNQRLPEDIRVRKSEETAPDFHPRHCESRKTYEYHILNSAFPNPVRRLYSHFTYVPLDAERMRQAAEYLVGEHDFASFCSAGSQAETTVRRIYGLSVERSGEEILIRVTGSGFLYNMVRIIAGTLMEAGCGRMEPERMKEILEAKDRAAAGPTAPACGLTLTEIRYEGQERDWGDAKRSFSESSVR